LNTKRFCLFFVVVVLLFISCSTSSADGDDDSVYNSCTITYDAHGGTGTVPASIVVTRGNSISVSENTGNLTKEGFKFAGWSVVSGGSVVYRPGDVINTSSYTNIYLYASWARILHVKYHNNIYDGGLTGSLPSDTCEYIVGDTVTLKTNSGNYSLPGYTFSGWNVFLDNITVFKQAGSSFVIPNIANDIEVTPNMVSLSSGGTGGTGSTTTHTYADVGTAEYALASGMAAGTGVSSTGATAYTTTSSSGTSLTCDYHLNGYSNSGLTLTGTITSVVSTAPSSTSTTGTVNVIGGTVTKIVYNYGSTGTVLSGTRTYTFSDGSTWVYNIATGAFTKS